MKKRNGNARTMPHLRTFASSQTWLTLRLALASIVAAAVACQPSGDPGLPTTPAACQSEAQPPVTTVSAIPDCVLHDSTNQVVGYVWGYSNTSGAEVTIPIGGSNQFIGTGAAQGQPTRFAPGETHAAFFTGANASTWLLGAGAPMSAAGKTACKTTWDGNRLVVTFGPESHSLEIIPDATSFIVPTSIDSSGLAVAELPGESGVSSDGAATYSVPLRVPAGVAGMQPNLSLQYNSRGGDGLVGVGWSLTGLSEVSRCPKSLAADGVAADIRFDDGDDFCLDGGKLRRLGTASGGAEYRPENSPFVRVVAMAPDALGPTEFVVYEPSGLIRRYGRSRATRLEGAIIKASGSPNDWYTVTEDTSRRGRLTWYLESEEDRFANRVIYEYKNTSTCATTSRDCRSPYEVYPTSIRYTASGTSTETTRSVTFSYDTQRLGARRPPRYTAGLGVLSPPLLTRIDMWAPNPVAAGRVRSYRLDYVSDLDSGFPGGGNLPLAARRRDGGLRRISAIRECDANDVCARPTTFEAAAKKSKPSLADSSSRVDRTLHPRSTIRTEARALWNTRTMATSLAGRRTLQTGGRTSPRHVHESAEDRPIRDRVQANCKLSRAPIVRGRLPSRPFLR